MNYWTTKENSRNLDVELLGGKGLHLFKLQDWGLEVPEFGVLTTKAFDYWSQNRTLPENLVSTIKDKISSWNADYIAVRSSMTGEDGEEASYAGMMETFLFVKPEDVETFIIKCFNSANSDRVKSYEKKKNLGLQKAAVVIQRMIPSDVSGVAFSRSPIGDSSMIYIESGWGLGEGVVSGLVEVDSFWCDRFGNTINSKIEKKEKKIYWDLSKEENTSLQDVPKELQNEVTLSQEKIDLLAQKVLQIEKEMGAPSDIEWSFEADKLYILQTRPITQKFNSINYYIDTNLSESYPGISSPLTSTFVSRAYTKVFTEAFDFLGFTEKRLEYLKPFLNTLVTNISGHMYYNLNSYYAVLKSLPGGEKNIENWHLMIGGKTEGLLDLSKIDGLTKKEERKAKLSLIKLFLFHDKIFKNFYINSNKIEKSFDQTLDSCRSAKEVISHIFKSIDEIEGFGLTALNDLLIMIVVKSISNLLERYSYNEEYLPSLIKTEDGVESLKPLKELDRICSNIEEPQKFLKVFNETLVHQSALLESDLYEVIFYNLSKSGYKKDIEEIKKYLLDYGERSFEELKLESMTFSQSPQNFYDLLSWKLNSVGTRELKTASTNLPQIDWKKLSIKDRVLLKILIYFAHKTIAMREKTRLLRGQYYGRIRRALIQCFVFLRKEYPETFLELNTNEFFSLDLNDLKKYLQSIFNDQQLLKSLHEKKKWSQEQYQYPEFLALDRSVKSPYFTQDLGQNNAVLDGDMIQGSGAAPGIIIGEPLVLETPQEALSVQDLSNKILVTKTTDPAWVFIMSQCKGLVSEKGSLLSHTAIIGRELGIPTVVGVKNAVQYFRKTNKIELNGETGIISICQ